MRQEEVILKEHNESNKSEDTPTPETQLVEIGKRLDHFEQLLKQTQRQVEQIHKQGEFQLSYSLGFGGIAVGAGIVTAGASLSDISIVIWGGVVAALGITAILVSRKKATKKVTKEQ
jgi:hypothetical protein